METIGLPQPLSDGECRTRIIGIIQELSVVEGAMRRGRAEGEALGKLRTNARISAGHFVDLVVGVKTEIREAGGLDNYLWMYSEVT